jgi:hypothetical protein
MMKLTPQTSEPIVAKGVSILSSKLSRGVTDVFLKCAERRRRTAILFEGNWPIMNVLVVALRGYSVVVSRVAFVGEFGFDCRRGHETRNCRATILFVPYV